MPLAFPILIHFFFILSSPLLIRKLQTCNDQNREQKTFKRLRLFHEIWLVPHPPGILTKILSLNDELSLNSSLLGVLFNSLPQQRLLCTSFLNEELSPLPHFSNVQLKWCLWVLKIIQPVIDSRYVTNSRIEPSLATSRPFGPLSVKE